LKPQSHKKLENIVQKLLEIAINSCYYLGVDKSITEAVSNRNDAGEPSFWQQ